MTDLETIDLPPELSKLEARLAQFRPQLDEKELQRLQLAVLREQCRLLDAKSSPDSRREYLVETFKRAEKEEVSLSLNKFLKSVRLTSALTGGIIGFLLGTLLTFAGIYLTIRCFTPEAVTSRPPVGSRSLDELHTDWNHLSRFPELISPTLHSPYTQEKETDK